MTEPAAPEQFVGTWRLVTMRAVRVDGAPGEPYGPQPLGYITYTADGHMCTPSSCIPIVAGSARRSRRSGSTMACAVWPSSSPNCLRSLGSPRRRRRRLAYSATWRSRGPEVVHHVTASVLPDTTGTDLVRTYAFDADRIR